MKLKQHQLIAPFALAAIAAMIATTVTLAFGATVGLAADTNGLEDAKHNVCEGGFTAADCPKVTGSNNIALGDEMMPALTSGSDNVALDFEALKANTTGTSNVAIGVVALQSNTTGNGNTATGGAALRSNTTGSANVATGADALAFNTIGEDNVASGLDALETNKTGSKNIASGFEALFSNTTGGNNIAVGYKSLDLGTTGSFNVALGTEAGHALTTGSNNIDISNVGVAGEAGTTRIGTERTQTRAFMAGIFPATMKGRTCVVKVNELGQLACKVTKAAASGVSEEGSPALLEKISHQQQQIDQLSSELRSLRKEIHTHR